MAILYAMSTPHVKATYSLDVPTLKILERVAKRWGVSKSEALRRAIHASVSLPSEPDPRLDALSELQSTAALSAPDADTWSAAVRDERRATRDPGARTK
jgi:ribbon-helix-helix CopG family protein